MIRDLLDPESGDLELREDNSGLVTVAGLSEVEAQSTSEVSLKSIVVLLVTYQLNYHCLSTR